MRGIGEAVMALTSILLEELFFWTFGGEATFTRFEGEVVAAVMLTLLLDVD